MLIIIDNVVIVKARNKRSNRKPLLQSVSIQKIEDIKI